MFNSGNFVLHSGSTSDFIIDCESLTDMDLEALAKLQSHRWFGKVVGVPNGGNRFAKALSKYTKTWNDRVLIVDDVLTTGNSMEEMKKKMNENDDMIDGLVIFARGPVPNWINAIFTFNEEL